MAEAWIGAVGVAGGVIIGELLGAWRAHRSFASEKRWALFETRQSKLEQLYELCEQQRESYRQAYGKVFDALVGPGGSIGDLGRVPSVPWARVAMLVSIYAPTLIRAANRLRAACARFDAMLDVAGKERPYEASDPVIALTGEYQLLGDAYERFFAELADHAAALQRETMVEVARFRLTFRPRTEPLPESARPLPPPAPAEHSTPDAPPRSDSDG
jgi:hypothetical protein